MQDHNALPVGTKLRQYRIDAVIGQGGFGITYLATDEDLEAKVAIKECYPRDFAHRSGTRVVSTATQDVNFDWALAKFLEEATTLAKFRHPGIVQVLQIIKDHNETAYMVLEFVDGMSFTRWLKSLGRRPTQTELMSVIEPLLVALELVHRNEYTHRDIAPDNIYIRKNGEPVLLDFGAARSSLGQHSKTLNLVVKEGYSPPEQYYADARSNPASDIYSLAATMYRAISGNRPVEASARSDALINGQPDPVEKLADLAPDGYEADFLAAVDAAMATQILARPKDTTTWLAQLKGTAELAEPLSEPVQATGATTVLARASSKSAPPDAGSVPKPSVQPETSQDAGPAKKKQGRGRMVAALVLVLCLGAAGYVGYLYLEEERAVELARQDEQAWKNADQLGTKAAYETYQANWPAGEFRNQAATALTAMRAPWTRVFGGTGNERATAGVAVEDGYVIAGTAETVSQGTQAWLSGIGLDGRQKWTQTFGGKRLESINAISATADGGALAVGFSTSGTDAGSDAYAVRIDGKGEMLWEKRYGNTADDVANGVISLADGGFVFAGKTEGGAGRGVDGWLVRLNSYGDVLWERKFGGQWDDELFGITVLPKGGYAVSGASQLSADRPHNFWFLKTTSDGALDFERKPGGASRDALLAVASRDDGSAVFVGDTGSFGTQTKDAFLSILSAENRSPPRIFSNKAGDDNLSGVAIDPDGNILAAGRTTSGGNGGSDGWVIKLDKAGKTTLWERYIGGQSSDRIDDVVALEDGGALLVGSTRSYGAGGSDVWILRLDNNGQGPAN